MKVVLSQLARYELERQLQFLIDHGAAVAARRLKQRTMSFLRETLARHPRFGVPLEGRGFYETWIPGTRFVIWYRVKGDTIEIARFWHSSQNRQPGAD